MARIRPTVPYSGIFPHREHRSKKGRDINYKFKKKINKFKKEYHAQRIEWETKNAIKRVIDKFK
jgi:hypothetical protein